MKEGKVNGLSIIWQPDSKIGRKTMTKKSMLHNISIGLIFVCLTASASFAQTTGFTNAKTRAQVLRTIAEHPTLVSTDPIEPSC
jgi:hypothetical protein